MQVLQAGDQKFLLLELEISIIEGLVTQLGFEIRNIEETPRVLTFDISMTERQEPFLLFDATDPGNLGWFSRCQFYVDALTGAILQTPIRIANVPGTGKRASQTSLRIQLEKELPTQFRMPGKQPLNEQAIYAILYNLLNALLEVGVAVCGKGIIRPLAGRSQGPRSRT